jgi:hypothetical protein
MKKIANPTITNRLSANIDFFITTLLQHHQIRSSTAFFNTHTKSPQNGPPARTV